MSSPRPSRALSANQLRERLFRPLGTDFPDPPPRLYHYTTHAGLAGILNSKQLWAGNLLFMNDASELEEGIRTFNRAIARAESSGQLDRGGEPFAEWYLNGPEFNVGFGIFGVCFSELGDDLSQWRAYAPRGGYSLGFDGPELQRMHTRGFATLDKVIYDPARKAAIADETVAAAVASWRDVTRGPTSSRRKRIKMFREVLEQVVRHCVCIMKHESFAAEKEWRLFVANSDLNDDAEVRYRAGVASVIPYVEIPIQIRGRRILREAIAGPSAHQDLAYSGLVGCVTDNGFTKVALSASDIPFRA